MNASDGPVVLITGALSGLGAATAQAFAELGAHLVLVDRHDSAPDGLLAGIAAAGGTAVVRVADVRDADSIGAAAQLAQTRFGRLDALVSCAAVFDQSRVATGDPENWRAVIETNLLGTVYAAHAALPIMLAGGAGHVFLLSSVSGRETYVGEPIYIASKWGVTGFAHALRQEVMNDNIRVTVVEPGLINTPAVLDNPALHGQLTAFRPLDPQDVAAAIVNAYQQPPHVLVSELTIRPLQQPLPDL